MSSCLSILIVVIGCLYPHNNHFVVYGKDVEIGGDGRVKPNPQKQVKFINKSKYRADLYYENGMYGSHLAILEANNGESVINSSPGHEFFITRHGLKEGLFDLTTKKQYRFLVTGKDNESFVIPETAAPSEEKCLDRFAVCESHAKKGLCFDSPGWMIVHCCESCDKDLDSRRLIDPNVRCTRENLNMTGAAWGPGDLHKLFHDWATNDEYKEYSPKVWSSPPDTASGDANKSAYGGQVGPWVMTFDTFMTDDEADALIQGGEISGFQRSTDQGILNAVGEREKVISTTRTSSNAWCNKNCENLPGVRSVTTKIEQLTKIPRNNYESFQILQYEHNQFYRSHHDTKQNDPSMCGPRILTFFLYLTDVEEGGQTHFNKLGITVEPKKGRALVWPSVLNEDPTYWDVRMYHEAQDVIQGKKVAANHWIHLYDYVTPNVWGCTGSFA